MNKVVNKYIVLLILINVILSSLLVLNNDIRFDPDIARDFLILQEIAEKKFILIGARSGSAPGFFHGPVWSYLNFPAFFIGNGNPVAVGYFWFALNILFVFSCYLIGKKMFSNRSGLLFALLVSIPMIGFTRGLYNPHGALLLMPIFIFMFHSYLRTNKLRYLFTHVLLIGLLIQFQIAVGAPLLLLSLIYTFLRKFRIKKGFSHLIYYLFILLSLLSYLLFDLRHNFSMTHAGISYLFGGGFSKSFNIIEIVVNRLTLSISDGLYFFPKTISYLNGLMFLVMSIGIFIVLKKKGEFRYSFLLFFYFGFFAISVVHGGNLANYFYFPLYSIPLLILLSLRKVVPNVIFSGIICIIFSFNLSYELTSLRSDIAHIGNLPSSWQFHNRIAKDIFKNTNNSDFGLFMHFPDVHGYQSKYSFVYQQKLNSGKRVHFYQKMEWTYVLFAGLQDSGINWSNSEDEFNKNTIQITKIPYETWEYNRGYKVALYNLNKNEEKIPFDVNLNNWLYFR